MAVQEMSLLCGQGTPDTHAQVGLGAGISVGIQTEPWALQPPV